MVIACIFPNDPIISYYDKGEIKERYYNPENVFDEIHIISLTEKDVSEDKVKKLVGSAKLKIHSIGKITLKNRKKNIEKVIKLVEDIKPDIIRAYNPLLEGWLAAKCSQKLKVPFFLSLHTQFDYNRKLARKKNLKKFLALKYTEKFIEPFVLKSADKITIVFKIIEPYVEKYVSKKPEILYNKVDLEKFSNAQYLSLTEPLIISVGRLIPEKNHECLIRAMERIDGHCLIIGNGEMYSELMNLIIELNLQNKVTIKKSVPNEQIPDYYKSASIFALAYDPDQEGLPIPVIEAIAAKLPIVISKLKEGYSENLENIAIFSERNPEKFAENINELLSNSKLRQKCIQNGIEFIKKFSDKHIENRESEIYKELLSK
ncbi:glycosyltransferase family 4 protein [Nitrosopumilus sp.]|uniref:glycosyltransferase family 4 protein n=1 Tax=Nitrosopumilus sp. TaxID=2024843 RepID=UPI00263A0836|nr:glycosyltransferase family 4 protein [Nitrosopumilus sp.]